MKIAIDLMGGDFAPGAVIDGCAAALGGTQSGTELILFGTAEAIAEAKKTLGEDGRVSYTEAEEIIGCDEQPVTAVRQKKNSSMVLALRAVADGSADAVVSAGNTGALLAGATLIVKRLNGVPRPALCAAIPNVAGGRTLLADSGANTDCRPEYLRCFAMMGSAYMKAYYGLEEPRVGLLNNGAEAEKGNALTKETYQLLQKTPVNFTGNCEARDALSGKFDVIVADGFDGNVLIKGIEGTASAMMTLLKGALTSSFRTKIGALLCKPAFRTLKKTLDYNEEGGAPLLGVRGGVIKAHGSSGAKAFSNAVLQAERLVAGGVVQTIAAAAEAFSAED